VFKCVICGEGREGGEDEWACVGRDACMNVGMFILRQRRMNECSNMGKELHCAASEVLWWRRTYMHGGASRSDYV